MMPLRALWAILGLTQEWMRTPRTHAQEAETRRTIAQIAFDALEGYRPRRPVRHVRLDGPAPDPRVLLTSAMGPE